ncbi:ricin-type beta-trefoil lectin domain protein [Desulfovibrio sp. OttesenSCG-928-F20]|nr:ricin-type beta-trefoil lectin domain protein [Desulfovibrio sp. OttesenSCG-928-F20]
MNLLKIAVVFCLLLLPVCPAQADEIVGIGGMCLDIKGGAAKGRQIIIYPCNGQLNQDWSHDIQTDSIRSAEGYCLDVQGNGGKGSKVIAWPCHYGRNQQWDYVQGTLRTPDNLCLDVRGGKAVKSAEVIVWPCKPSSSNQNQRWQYR